MRQQKEEILAVIKDNVDKKFITAWSLGDDVLHDLASQSYKPDYFYYEQKYIAWLKDLCDEIRKIDPVRPIIMDLEWDKKGRKQFDNYKTHIPQINTYMLSVDLKDSALLNTPLEEGMAWGKVDVRLWPFIPGMKQSGSVQWQDIETTDHIKLNGLLDLKGRKKQSYRDVANIWGNGPTISSSIPDISILKPAQLTIVNTQLLYHIVYEDKNSHTWKLFDYDDNRIKFEWYLVRTDRFDNTMFMNRISDQPYVALTIPPDPQFYKLYVEAVSGEDVRTANTTLNTPLE